MGTDGPYNDRGEQLWWIQGGTVHHSHKSKENGQDRKSLQPCWGTRDVGGHWLEGEKVLPKRVARSAGYTIIMALHRGWGTLDDIIAHIEKECLGVVQNER